MCIIFLWPLRLVGSSVSIRRLFIDFKSVLLITRLLRLVRSWMLINRFDHNSWAAVVTPTDRPTSVRNRCTIEVFGGVCVLSRRFLDSSVDVGVFVIGLSRIFFLFLSVHMSNAQFIHIFKSGIRSIYSIEHNSITVLCAFLCIYHISLYNTCVSTKLSSLLDMSKYVFC